MCAFPPLRNFLRFFSLISAPSLHKPRLLVTFGQFTGGENMKLSKRVVIIENIDRLESAGRQGPRKERQLNHEGI